MGRDVIDIYDIIDIATYFFFIAFKWIGEPTDNTRTVNLGLYRIHTHIPVSMYIHRTGNAYNTVYTMNFARTIKSRSFSSVFHVHDQSGD